MKSIHPAKLIHQFLLLQTSWLPFAATAHSSVVKQEWFFSCYQLFNGLWLGVLVVPVYQLIHGIFFSLNNWSQTQHFHSTVKWCWEQVPPSHEFHRLFVVFFFVQYKLEIYSSTIPTPTFSSVDLEVFIVCCTSALGRGQIQAMQCREGVLLAGRKEGLSSKAKLFKAQNLMQDQMAMQNVACMYPLPLEYGRQLLWIGLQLAKQ